VTKIDTTLTDAESVALELALLELNERRSEESPILTLLVGTLFMKLGIERLAPHLIPRLIAFLKVVQETDAEIPFGKRGSGSAERGTEEGGP
jgi:hypothetical protein